MMTIVDTNIISEATKIQPSEKVTRWMRDPSGRRAVHYERDGIRDFAGY